MQDPTDAIPQVSRREPWNKGKLIGAKLPLRPKHVWSIRTKPPIRSRVSSSSAAVVAGIDL
jgi:hypothetical protein